MRSNQTSLPVAVIGAGPVGLAAAAHLLERGEDPLIFEAGESIGHSVRKWAHVRMFSPWRYNIDSASRRLLEAAGWVEPDAGQLPTGGEIVGAYLQPLAETTSIARSLRLAHRVVAVTREGLDKVRTGDRTGRPFVVRTSDAAGNISDHRVKAVIDASGTWESPNPMGADGLAVIGESEVAMNVDYGIPFVLGEGRQEFRGATVLVVGSGHSSFNLILDLLKVKESYPETSIFWAMRKKKLGSVFGGGANDALPARGELGTRVREAIETGKVELLTPSVIDRLARDGGRVQVSLKVGGTSRTLPVDRIVVATGFRPDFHLTREIRLEIDPALECVKALGPLIDPNEHSCGSVRPHGAKELSHPDAGYYIVGMKSYGRAPTFLLATGYEQVRSVVAEIAGDHEAAARVELDLPETGVCRLSDLMEETRDKDQGCCGTGGGDQEPEVAVPRLQSTAAKARTSCCG